MDAPDRLASDAQARIYEEGAEEYDRLIAAEDAENRLGPMLEVYLPATSAVIADVGAGTGRIARLLAARSAHVHLIDRAPAMLAIARRHLERIAPPSSFTIHEADARSLPLPDRSADLCVAGWVFGHFRHWMPAGWRDEVDRALSEMRRVVVPGGTIVVIETLGTGHERPRQHAALDEYFDWLEAHHGFTRDWLRTDYRFADADEAARVCGRFFGEELGARIRAKGDASVPECTAIFTMRAPR